MANLPAFTLAIFGSDNVQQYREFDTLTAVVAYLESIHPNLTTDDISALFNGGGERIEFPNEGIEMYDGDQKAAEAFYAELEKDIAGCDCKLADKGPHIHRQP